MHIKKRKHFLLMITKQKIGLFTFYNTQGEHWMDNAVYIMYFTWHLALRSVNIVSAPLVVPY